MFFLKPGHCLLRIVEIKMLRFPGTPSFICIEAVSEYRKSYAVVEISIHLCTPQCKSVYLPLFAEGRLAQRIIGSCSMPINIDNRTEALNFDLIFFCKWWLYFTAAKQRRLLFWISRAIWWGYYILWVKKADIPWRENARRIVSWKGGGIIGSTTSSQPNNPHKSKAEVMNYAWHTR